MPTSNDGSAASSTFSLGGDLPVRRLGFGAMRITGEGIWGDPPSREESKRVLRRVVELGVTFIDTADSYGPHVSESLIAEALSPFPDDLTIATKGGLLRDGPGQWRPDGRPEHLRAACEGSLQRLKLDRIPLYQFHRPDPRVPLAESVGELVRLKEEGKIRHIGLSNVTVDQLHEALDLTPIVSVQNRFGLEDRSSDDVLNRCEQLNIAFIPWAPLAQARGGANEVVSQIAERHDATPMQIALAWLLARSPVMLPIPGTNSVAHLEENVAAASIALAPDEVGQLNQVGGGGGMRERIRRRLGRQ